VSAVTIRELQREDYDSWMELWRGYLSFYRTDISEQVTASTFARLCDDGGDDDDMLGLVAVDEHGQLLGLAHSVFHPSTWALRGYCYLEDLFVARSARGDGVGKQLIEATADAARERGMQQLYWHTQQFNGAARSLYDTVGQLTSMVVYERKL
jgi:GNAT superfamily N-acetyltransferase